MKLPFKRHDDYDDYEAYDENDETLIRSADEQMLRKAEKKRDIGIKPIHIVLIAFLALLAVGGYVGLQALMNRVETVADTNQALSQDIASYNQTVYIAARNLKAGEPLIFSGEGANMATSQVVSSYDINMYATKNTGGYAATDIPADTPIFKAMVSPEPKIDPESLKERVVEKVDVEIPETLKIPFGITAEFITPDGKATKPISESIKLSLDTGCQEESFGAKKKDIGGYKLSGIRIGKTPVHSFGAMRKQTTNGQVFLYYYTLEDGLTRVIISEPITVSYVYEKLPEDAAEPAEGEQPAEGAEEAAEPQEETPASAADMLGIPVDAEIEDMSAMEGHETEAVGVGEAEETAEGTAEETAEAPAQGN